MEEKYNPKIGYTSLLITLAFTAYPEISSQLQFLLLYVHSLVTDVLS